MRRQQRYLNRERACSDCVLVARASKVLKKQGLPRFRTQCPLCNRKLLVAATASVLALSEVFLEALRHYGTLVAKARKIPVDLFSFDLEGREIFSDPSCGCNEDPNVLCGDHPRMGVRFELKDLHGGEEGMFFIGPDGIQEDFHDAR
jgi:hypothetical protein